MDGEEWSRSGGAKGSHLTHRLRVEIFWEGGMQVRVLRCPLSLAVPAGVGQPTWSSSDTQFVGFFKNIFY